MSSYISDFLLDELGKDDEKECACCSSKPKKQGNITQWVEYFNMYMSVLVQQQLHRINSRPSLFTLSLVTVGSNMTKEI